MNRKQLNKALNLELDRIGQKTFYTNVSNDLQVLLCKIDEKKFVESKAASLIEKACNPANISNINGIGKETIISMIMKSKFACSLAARHKLDALGVTFGTVPGEVFVHDGYNQQHSKFFAEGLSDDDLMYIKKKLSVDLFNALLVAKLAKIVKLLLIENNINIDSLYFSKNNSGFINGQEYKYNKVTINNGLVIKIVSEGPDIGHIYFDYTVLFKRMRLVDQTLISKLYTKLFVHLKEYLEEKYSVESQGSWMKIWAINPNNGPITAMTHTEVLDKLDDESLANGIKKIIKSLESEVTQYADKIDEHQKMIESFKSDQRELRAKIIKHQDKIKALAESVKVIEEITCN